MLEGIRVLDLGRFVACPFSGALLADLGAEVIRVEGSHGAEDRFVGKLTPSGDSYTFVNANRNKKAISLNFVKNNKARQILNELVKYSDVVIENFSPDVAKSIGITYDNFKKIKPDIIFAEISAFGSYGPYSHRIGFDHTIKAMSGSMSISGPPNTPCRDQIYYIDYGTAFLATVGVLAALYHRQRTGQGQIINVSLLQTAVTYMAPVIGEWETSKALRKQIGNRSYWTGPCDLCQTKDGKWVMVAIITNGIWRRFCRFIGREDLAADPKFQSDQARWEHRDILDPIVKEWVASQTAEDIVATAETIPIPLGICYSHTEVAHDPQVEAEEMLTEVTSPDGHNKVLVTNVPLKMSKTPLKIERSFPLIGQHNREIYCGVLGYKPEELCRFKQQGII